MQPPEAPMDAAQAKRSIARALGKREREPDVERTSTDSVAAGGNEQPPTRLPCPTLVPDAHLMDAQVVADDAAENMTLLHSRDHYRFHKRVPMRRESGRCDVYVTRSARFRALQARCIALLDSHRRATLHALGAAVGRACDVALAVQNEARGEVVIGVQTDTVVVYDDFEPLVPGLPIVTKERSKSAVHITLTPTKDYV